jgi:hypothetical protein
MEPTYFLSFSERFHNQFLFELKILNWRPYIFEFADITEKTFEILRLLAKFLTVPKSPKEPITQKLHGRLMFLLQITLNAS